MGATLPGNPTTCTSCAPILQRTRHLHSAPSCSIVLWRHIEKCGGTSIRIAFERLELPTNFSAISRPERLEHTQWNCRKRDVRGYRPRALRAFNSCVQLTGVNGGSHGWSVEYHVPDDGSKTFARDLYTLRSSFAASPPSVRALAVTFVREPHSWYASEWRAPEGLVWRALIAAGTNFTRFVIALGPGWQYRALLHHSGLNDTSDTAHALGAAGGEPPSTTRYVRG